MTPTLFLDFDGCLHPNRVVQSDSGEPALTGPGTLFIHAGALAEVLAPYDCRIVLSTAWAARYGLVPARKMLPASLSPCAGRGPG